MQVNIPFMDPMGDEKIRAICAFHGGFRHLMEPYEERWLKNIQPSREDWLKNGQERINGGVIMARNSKWSEDMLLGGSLGTAMAEVVIRKYLPSIWILLKRMP